MVREPFSIFFRCSPGWRWNSYIQLEGLQGTDYPPCTYRAIAPSLSAVSEYRVDRLHQRLLQAAFEEDRRTEPFHPAEFGDFDGSPDGIGGDFHDSLVREGDLGAGVGLKLNDCEGTDELGRSARNQTPSSQLLRKFEVKEDVEELHAFFMQKECDRQLVRLKTLDVHF